MNQENYPIGTRLKMAPLNTGLDPYWITVDKIDADGVVTWSDDDGMVEAVEPAEWAGEYVPRIIEAELAGDEEGYAPPSSDDLLAGEPQEEEEFQPTDPAEEEAEGHSDAVPGEEAYGEPAPQYMSRNAEQNANANAARKLWDLGDLAMRRDNLEQTIRKCQEELAVVEAQIKAEMHGLARVRLLVNNVPDGDEIPFGRPAVDAATRELIENTLGEYADMLAAPAEPIEPRTEKKNDAIGTAQARAIAEQMSRNARQKADDDDYAALARKEMQRPLSDVKGITAVMFSRMAEKGIRTLGDFSQAADENPRGWWENIKYVSAEKAAVLEGAIETHWKVFRARHGHEE